jgi:hypothetical protein
MLVPLWGYLLVAPIEVKGEHGAVFCPALVVD